MAYILPTAADLKARIPAFAEVDDALITFAITDAARSVDNTWTEGDYATAIIYLAAHNMVGEGVFGRETDIASSVTSSKLGDAQDSYGSLASAGADGYGEYGTTIYGVRYMRLLYLNVAGVALLC